MAHFVGNNNGNHGQPQGYQTPEPNPTPAAPTRSIKDDILASVVVFLVALPLCLGIALASGAPVESGIISGIVAGVVVGFLAGSPLQVSGPAAGLSVIVLEFIQRSRQAFLDQNEGTAAETVLQTLAANHALSALGVALVLAGIMQMAAGGLRLGQWFRAVSPAVILGMLAGIGVLIFASQFHVMVDEDMRKNGLANLAAIPESIYKGITGQGDKGAMHQWAGLTALLTIVVLLGWKAVSPKALKVLPSALIAVVLATLLAVSLDLGIRRIEMSPNLLGFIEHRLPTFESVQSVLTWPLVGFALTLAVIASAETLLCATAVDKLHQGPRTKYDREMTAQGVGNTLCGLLGGLPMTGVIVRSAANVEAGAKTRLSAILHGGWLLIFVLLLPAVLNLIPTACLAAILVLTGYKLVNIKAIRDLARFGAGEVMVYAATVICIVAFDLLTGVLVGVGLSAVKLLLTFCSLKVRVQEQPEEGRTVMYLSGAATFVRLPKLAAALENVPPSTELHVHFEQLNYIDHACLDLLMNWEKQHHATGGRLVIDWDGLAACFRRAPSTRQEAVPHGEWNGHKKRQEETVGMT